MVEIIRVFLLELLEEAIEGAVVLAMLQLGVGAEHTALAQQMGTAAGAGLHDLRPCGQLVLELLQLQQRGGLLGFALCGQFDGLSGP